MALEAGDVVSRLLLDMTDFRRALKSAPGIARKDLDKVNRGMASTMRKMDKSVKGFVDKSVVHGKRFEKSWWDRFGRIAVGFTIAYRAMRLIQRGIEELAGTFSKGIKAIDDFRTAVIRTAAALSMLSDEPSTEGLQAYLAYSKDTFETLELVAARHFATADDLREAYAKFTTMALVPVGPEQLESMASLVDWILIAEEAMGRTLQIRTEIESVIEGTLRKGAVMARMANNMLDDYKGQLKQMEGVASATERSKMFFDMMAPILQAITRYSDEILKTHMAWRANIDAIFKKIWRAGLNQAYEDLLNIMRDISDVLIQHGKLTDAGYKVAYAYHVAWEALKAVVLTVRDVAVSLYTLWDDMTFHLSPVLHSMKLVAMGVVTIKAGLESWVIILREIAPLTGDLIKSLVLQPAETLKKIGEMAWGVVIQRQITTTSKFLADAGVRLERYQSGLSETGEVLKETRTLWERLLVPGQTLTEAIQDQSEHVFELGEKLHALIEKQKGAREEWNNLFARIPLNKLSRDLDGVTERLEDSLQAIGDWTPGQGYEEWKKHLEEGDEMLKGLRALYTELLGLLKAGDKLTDKMVKDQIKAYQIIFDIYKGLIIAGQDYYEQYRAAQEQLLQIQKDRVERELKLVVDGEKAKLLANLWYVVERKKLDDALNDAIWKSSQHLLERMQDATADAFYDILTDQEGVWENFFQTIEDLFVRTLAEMAAEALKKQIVLSTISGLGAGGGGGWSSGVNPMTGAALTGGAVAGGGALGAAAFLGPAGIAAIAGIVTVYSVLDSMHERTSERNRLEGIRLRQLAASWRAVSTEIIELLHANTDLERVFRSINEQFDTYRNTLVGLRASAERLTWVEEQRQAALEAARQKLVEEFAAPLESIIAGFTMGDVANELRELDIWYKDQIDNARTLGQESVNLLREALELSKKQLAIKQMETLLAMQAQALETITTIGMTPMELQIHMVEKARDELGDAIGGIQDSIDALTTSIADAEGEIASLQGAYTDAIRLSGEAENRWLDAQQAVIDAISEITVTEHPAFKPAVTLPYKEAIERDVFGGRVLEWDEFLDYLEGQGYFEHWKTGTPFYAGLSAEYMASQTAWAEAQAEYGPLIATIPGEIDVLEGALVDYRQSVTDLVDELEAAGKTAQAAYVAQMAALTETFLGGLQDIIRSHTMKDYELSLYNLNEWYAEQVIAAEALGLSLDLVNIAYSLQRDAIIETAQASSDMADSLNEWKSVLESLENQIFKIQTTLTNPLDVLERMSIVEQDIISSLGSQWKEGIFDLADITPEGMGDLQALLDTYLDLAGEAFQRPSLEYGNIYESVLDALQSMKTTAEEQVSIYELQLEQLEAQLEMVDLLRDMTLIQGSFQTGTRYVPRTGPYLLHEGEEVNPAGETGIFSFYLTINEAKRPHETGVEVVEQVETFMRSSRGGKIIQQRARGR